MAKTVGLAALIQRREELAKQLKKIDAAIRIAREQEARERHAKVLLLLKEKGLLDADLVALGEALEQVNQKIGTVGLEGQ